MYIKACREAQSQKYMIFGQNSKKGQVYLAVVSYFDFKSQK